MGTTRFPDGITTAVEGSNLETFILPDSSTAHVFFDDFTNFDSTLWSITLEGSSTISLLANASQGVLSLDAINNEQLASLQTEQPSFTMEVGKQMWAKARITLGDTTGPDKISWVFGLQVQNADPFISPDGIYIEKSVIPEQIEFKLPGMTPALTILDSSAFGSLVGDTTEVGFHFDGVDTVTAFADDVALAKVIITSALLSSDLALTVALNPVVPISALSIEVDYIFAAKER